MKEVIRMKEQKKKPCFEISYIKVTYDKDGNVHSVTVKVENKAKAER